MVEARHDAVILEGVLQKRRASKLSVLSVKPWDQRWFILTSNELRYFSSKETCDWGFPPKVLSVQSLRHYESLSDTVFQLYFPGRILQLKAQHKEEANRWLACLHSLHLIAVNSSFTQTANRQQSAAHSHASDLHQHDSAASVASPPVKHKLVDQPDDGVLFIKVEATGPKPASPRQHRISQLSHLSIEGSGLSFTPLSDHAAHSPFLGTRDQHADGLQPKAETAICSRCKSIASITLLAASQEELQDVSEGVHGGRSVSPIEQQNDAQADSLQMQPSSNLEWMQRHLTSSPFDRSFTAGSVTDEDLYALPQNARPGRLEPSIDAEGIPDPHEIAGTAAGASVHTYVNTDANKDANTDAGMNPEGNDDDGAADTSQWHHHADDLMQASMISNRRADGTQQTILHSPCSQVAFADVDADSGLASPSALQSEHHSLLLPYDSSSPAQVEHASTTGRMHSTFATSWLHSTGSSALSSQSSSMQPVATKMWVSHSAQQLSNTSSSTSLHELQELGPHPPAQPSTHSGLLTGRSGFTGQRGVTGDPRLRRFKDAHPSGAQTMPLLQELRPNDIRSEHSGHLDQVNHPVSPSSSQHMQQALAWSGSGRQTEDRIELAQSGFHAHPHMLTPTKSWTAYCSDSDESDTSYSLADGRDSSLVAGQDTGPSRATLA